MNIKALLLELCTLMFKDAPSLAANNEKIVHVTCSVNMYTKLRLFLLDRNLIGIN